MAWVGFSCEAGLVQAVQTGSVANFFMDSPARVEQYDLTNRQWLPVIPLSSSHGTLTAGWIDADGIYAAYGVSAYRYDLNGSNEVHLTDPAETIINIFSDGDILLLNHPSGYYTRVTSVNKVSNAVVDTHASYTLALYGASIAPSINKLFGRSGGISPPDITYVTYNSDGSFITSGESSYHGDYPGAMKAWVFPDDARVVDSSGTIYSSSDLIYQTSFASEISDLAFYGNELPVVLDTNTLTTYTRSILPAGSATLDHSPDRIFIESEDVLTFTFSDTATHGFVVQSIALSELKPPVPGDPINPAGLAYTPDHSFVDKNGIVCLFSKARQSVFRWDTATEQYTDTIPLVGTPIHAAYSADNHEIYLAYTSGSYTPGLIRAIDLTETNFTERPFATLPMTPYGLSTAGSYVFTVDPTGAWESHRTFGPDGALIDTVDWNYNADEFVWNNANQKMYFGYSTLMSEEINADGVTYPSEPPGGIGATRRSSGSGASHIRVAPDGSIVVRGSGDILDAVSLERLGTTLTNNLADIAWLGNDIFTTRTVNGNTLYEKWIYPGFELGFSVTNAGTAHRLIAMNDFTMVGISIGGDGIPAFKLIGPDLDTADTLLVNPIPAVSIEGYEGRPFMPSNIVYTLENVGTSNLAWSAAYPAGVLLADSDSGVLSGGADSHVNIALNPDNVFIPADIYDYEITFFNHNTGRERVRPVKLTVYPFPQAPDMPTASSPIDGGAGMNIDVILDWEHANGGDDPGPWDTASRYRVLFGTNTAELVEIAAGLTNTMVDPGLLEIDTTYYWQVVASNVIGVTTGQIWSFSTWLSGPVDHFVWSAIDSNQQVSVPIDVSVTGFDSYGHPAVVFNELAPIYGFNTMDGGYSMLGGMTHDRTYNYSDDSRGLRFRVDEDLSITHLLHYWGTNVCLWTDDGNLLYEAPVTNLPGSWSETELVDPISLYSGVVYRVSTEGGTYYRNYDNTPRDFEHGEVLNSCYSYNGGYPSYTYSSYTELVDFRYAPGHQTPIAILPTHAVQFVDGVWTGQVVVAEYAEKAFLRAQTPGGARGDSMKFRADYIGDLTVTLPDHVTEGDGVRANEGQISVSAAPLSNLVVTLVFDPVLEATVPAQVVIPAGDTNILFDVTVPDDALLNGSRTSVLHVASFGYRATSALLPVHDNESTTLNVTLPATSYEGAGTVAGAVITGAAPTEDVVVHLISNNPSEVGSGYAILPAGQTFAHFILPVLDDNTLDGIQTATIEAYVANWQSGYASVFVFDDETNGIDLQLPASLTERDGVITNGGVLSIPALAMVDVNLLLTCSDPTELVVPAYVTIPAGTNQVVFDVSVVDDADTDGTTTVSVQAQAPGYIQDSGRIEITDNDPHHLLVEGLSGDLALFDPVSISVSVRTLDGHFVDVLSNSVSLAASGDRGAVSMAPGALTNVVDGVASGSVSFGHIGNDILLVASSGGLTGTSSVFNVISSQIVIIPGGLTNTLAVAGETAARTMVISNAGNTDLEFEIRGEGDTEADDPSLILHYTFDADIGTTVVDQSGHGNDGTLMNNCTYTKGVYGAGLETHGNSSTFSSAGGHVLLPLIDFNSMNEVTVALWVKEETLHLYQGESYISFGSHPGYLDISRNSASSMRFICGTDLTTGIYPPIVNAFAHYALTYSNGIMRTYRDGVFLEEVNCTLSIIRPDLAALGRHWWNSGSSTSTRLTAVYDDLRIYERALSETEITGLAGPGSDSGLVAGYSFNGDAADESGNGYDGVPVGAILVTNRFGEADSAYYFDGLNDRIDLPNQVLNFERTDSFSQSFWIKTAESDLRNNIIAKMNSSLDARGINVVLADGILRVLLMNHNTVGNKIAVYGTTMVSDDQWHHVAVTYDGSSMASGVMLYIDGVLESATVVHDSLTGTILNSAIPTLGSRNSGYYYGGILDDVRIYDRVLSVAEVEVLFTGSNSESNPPDIAWLSVDPVSGIIAPGSNLAVAVAFDAAGMVAGNYSNSMLSVVCNDAVSPTKDVPTSMYALPPAPVMGAEPAMTYGSSNAVSWSMTEGPVSYLAEVATDTVSAPQQQSGWLDATSHAFNSLATNQVYYYRARASVESDIGRLEGPWSGWVWSTQLSMRTDADGDGMHDWWEELHFGGTGVAGLLTDSDGDGQSDHNEFIAGMNPTDPASCFTINDTSVPTNGQFAVYWDSVTGRVYSVQWKASMTNAFAPMATNIFYPQNSYTDAVHNAEESGFYRIEVELP